MDDKPEFEGQMNWIDYLGCYEPQDRLTTTGLSRTGCMFCMFGAHLEKEPNRFQRMKVTHPKQYAYCMDKLGLREVLEETPDSHDTRSLEYLQQCLVELVEAKNNGYVKMADIEKALRGEYKMVNSAE